MQSERSTETLLLVLLGLLLVIVIADLLLPLIRKHSRVPASLRSEANATCLLHEDAIRSPLLWTRAKS